MLERACVSTRVTSVLVVAMVVMSGLVAAASPAAAQGNEAPEVDFSFLLPAQTPPLELNGYASDDSAVAAVSVAIRNRDGLWLRSDGTFGAFMRLPASLSQPGDRYVSWSFEVDLPEGDYDVSVVAFDDQQVKSRSVFRNVTLTNDVDVTNPKLTVEIARNGVYSSSPVTLSGTASDDRGVDRVRVQVDSQDCFNVFEGPCLPFAGDGDNGNYLQEDADLSIRGADSTDWSITFDAAPGRSIVQVFAVDDFGNRGGVAPFRISVVSGPDREAPDTTIAFPEPDQFFQSGEPARIRIDGSDDQLDLGAFVAIRDLDTGLLRRDDGSFAPGFNISYFPYTDDYLYGGARKNLLLPDGRYQLLAVSVDAAGKLDQSSASVMFNVGRTGLIDPTVTVDPAVGDEPFVSPFVLRGSAADNTGVIEVGVAIRNVATNQWLYRWYDSSLQFASGFDRVDATLAAPRAPSTEWSLALDLPPGTYDGSVRSVDLGRRRSVAVPFRFKVAG